MTGRPRRRPEPRCPIRPGQPCTLCQIDVTGPQDCGLVYLVMSDDELRAAVRRAGQGTYELVKPSPARTANPPAQAASDSPNASRDLVTSPAAISSGKAAAR